MIPRLSPFRENTLISSDTKYVRNFYYTQVLDHFNYMPESYTTFDQRCFINFKFWGGANLSAPTPIFVYFGGETSLDGYQNVIGFMEENVSPFKALPVYIEHRYYGKSVPFRSREEVSKNIGCCRLNNHLTRFQEASETCYEAMLNSWFEIDKVASEPNGLSILTQRFNTCNPLNQSLEPSSYLEKSFVEKGKKDYGVSPCPHWISTYYGGQNIKFVLKRVGSNIIFSNGLKDPYSSGGILSDLSKSLVAISTINGSHCLDLQPSQQNNPEWLIEQGKKEVEIIHGWIALLNN